MTSAPERFDVAILGGGPAGSAAALSLRRLRPALRVALVESSRYMAWRAGETLSPGCQELLAGLGCWERFAGERFLESFGTRAVWGGDEPYDHEFLFSTRGNGWHVDRARFDSLLCDAAHDAGAEVLTGARFVAAERLADRRWKLALRGGPPDLIEASWVVDTTGRSAVFATRQGAHRLASDRLVGVAVRFRTARPPDLRTLVEAQPDGWWYSAAIPDSGLIVVWMSDADLVRRQGLGEAPRWLHQLAKSRHTAARVAGAVAESRPVIRAAGSQRLSEPGGEGWIAAGDAASTFDPLSSQGILKALRNGKIASFVVLDGLAGRASSLSRYQQLLAAEHSRYLETRAWFYLQEQRWPESSFWSSRR